MSTWISLRKSGCLVYISWANTFSGNLWARDFQLKTSPEFELSFDLNTNLSSRNKETNSYLDARELADGEIKNLNLVQIDEDQVVEGISRALQRLEPPSEWKLTIQLEGEWGFHVKPRVQQQGNREVLSLDVLRGDK